MPFFEVKQEFLQKEDKKLILRFLMDTRNNATLHVWSDHSGHIERFQLAKPGNIIEWKKSRGFLTGNVDEGDDKGLGIKESPIIQLNQNQNRKLVEKFSAILNQALKTQGVSPLGSVLKFVLERIKESRNY